MSKSRDDYDEPGRKPPDKRYADMGNTLDYYNDDLSRKAVGKLFGETKPASVARPSIDDFGKTGETPTPDDDIVRGFERAPEAKRQRIEEFDYDTPADGEYDFSLYRKKERSPSGWSETENTAPVSVKKIPRQETVKIDNPVRVPYQNVVKPQAPAGKRPAPGAKQAPPRKKPYREEDYDDDFSLTQMMSPRTIVIAIIVFLAVVLIATLVFQMVSAKSKAADLEAENAVLKEIELRYNQLSMDYDTLKAQNDSLKTQLETAIRPPEVTTPADAGQTGEGAETPGGQPSSGVAAGTTYTVKSGDTLGAISSQFYGDASGVQKIQDANGITDPRSLRVGQELKIPQ